MHVYEVVHPLTLTRGGSKISLKRGSRLKIEPERHGFSDSALQRAIRDGKLRLLPLGEGAA